MVPWRPAPVAPRELLSRQFSSLSIRNYRLYFIGQLISLVGTWAQRLGLAWLVLKLTGSPLALGITTTLEFLPITLFTLFGGVFADRVPKRRLLMVTQSLAMAQAFILGVLVLTDTVVLWHVYALALWLGVVNAFDGPVRQAFVVELVGREQLTNAVALNSSIFNTARIIGPAVGGVTIAIFGISTTFLINGFSYVGVLAAYQLMKPSEFRALSHRPPQGSVWHQLAEGVQYSVRTPKVFFYFILLAFIGCFGYNFTVIVPLVAEFVLEVGAGKFGLLTSAMGAGSLISALTLAAGNRTSVRLLLVAATAFVALLAAVAISPFFLVTAVLLMLLGMASVAFSTTINTSLQLTVPDELRGRVMSIYFLLFAGSTPLGSYVTGALAQAFGVQVALAALASICGLGILVALLYRASHAAAIAAQPGSVATTPPQ